MNGALPRQASLRRLVGYAVKPNRDLGQNFLIDSNLLEVIGKAAELEQSDVVLEVGGGLGVLSEYLAERVKHLHVVEIDRRLAEPLTESLAPFPESTTLYFADAMELDLNRLLPQPNKFVANLPYGIAAPLLIRTVQDLPEVTLWVAMVQREVGERFAAKPGSAAYGLPSVLAQLACEVRVVRAVPRTVFHPVPNVDSVLISLRRFAPAPAPALVSLVRAAFAHRRKALARSLELSLPIEGIKERSREVLTQLGHPADLRAERLGPEQFRELGRLLELT